MQDSEIPKSRAIWKMDASPVRAKAMTFATELGRERPGHDADPYRR
jgi:hypothetical protein